MRNFLSAYIAVLILSISSCTENKKANMTTEQGINDELKKISGLLQDSSFALEMAKNQEAAYYVSQGQAIPSFVAGNADTMISKSFKEEKIATNIAALYALECGIGALIENKGGTLVDWLNKIAKQQSDPAEQLLLNRFANATWKAGQPFRSLKRIFRDNFVSSVFLPESEIKKDHDQIAAAAKELTTALSNLRDSSQSNQLQKLDQLLKDKQFAADMAMHMEAAYYSGQQQPAPPFLKPGEDTATIKKSMLEEKIAINIAGFYALECGLSYLATTQNKLPSNVMQSIQNDSISINDKRLFERFANAAWKAGQPFRGLSRIERKTFTPFDLLPPEEIEKDWVQIKAAARLLLKKLEK